MDRVSNKRVAVIIRGHGSMVEHLVANQRTGVRFSLAAHLRTVRLIPGFSCAREEIKLPDSNSRVIRVLHGYLLLPGDVCGNP